MSKVIVIRNTRWKASEAAQQPAVLRKMFGKGFSLLEKEGREGRKISGLFSPQDSIGIKINTIGGEKLSTLPPVSMALADSLHGLGIEKEHILIWDRTNRELREAGYRLNSNHKGIKVFGTDSRQIGYTPELIAHRSIGSRFSLIQTLNTTASISLAILKDHGLAGITAGMKNYFGAIHNPNKYHDFNCNPFVADVFDSSPIQSKHRLTILDALTVQFHLGPAYHPQWASPFGALIFSRDPVAADAVGRKFIEELRASRGLPTLKEENREPLYLSTAESLGLGTADLSSIDLIQEEI